MSGTVDDRAIGGEDGRLMWRGNVGPHEHRLAARARNGRKRVEVVLDARCLLGCRERRGNEIDDIAEEGGREQRDLELVHVATVDEHVGLPRGDLLEARADRDGRVAPLACERRRPGCGR